MTQTSTTFYNIKITKNVSQTFNNNDVITVEYLEKKLLESNIKSEKTIENIINIIDTEVLLKSGGIMSGNLNIDIKNNAYLYIGNNWRINASTDNKILIFEYNENPLDKNSIWKIGTPTIQFNIP